MHGKHISYVENEQVINLTILNALIKKQLFQQFNLFKTEHKVDICKVHEKLNGKHIWFVEFRIFMPKL